LTALAAGASEHGELLRPARTGGRTRP